MHQCVGSQEKFCFLLAAFTQRLLNGSGLINGRRQLDLSRRWAEVIVSGPNYLRLRWRWGHWVLNWIINRMLLSSILVSSVTRVHPCFHTPLVGLLEENMAKIKHLGVPLNKII